jgi:hypothetical protein
LAATPAGLLVLQATFLRLASRLRPGSSRLAATAAAFLAGYLLIPGAAWLRLFAGSLASREGMTALIYGTAVYLCLAFCYAIVFVMTETARRIHILYELARQPRLDRQALEGLYAPEIQVDLRLQRLTAGGQLSLSEGRYRLRGRLLWAAARVIAWWSRCLGFRFC